MCLGETGRFIMKDNQLSVGIGVRPILGSVTLKSVDDDDLSIIDIGVGASVAGYTWIAHDLKLTGSLQYFRTPEVLSMGDFSYSQLVQVKVGVPIIATSEAYISYISLEAEPEKERRH